MAGAHALGLVHRDVGALQQPHRVLRVVREERDADAGVDVDVDAADRERFLERGAQPQARGAGRGLVAGLEDDRELVAAQPRQRVVLAQQLLQPRADLAQHLVAGVVAERVVELLEAVEVDQQQRELVAVRAARLDRRVQRVDQVAAVAEAGEVVGHRLLLRVAQALDHGPAGAPHADEHGGDGERDGDRLDVGELPDAEQRERDRGVGQQRGEHDRAELGGGLDRPLGQPGGEADQDRRGQRAPRAGGERRQRRRARARRCVPGRQRESPSPAATPPIADRDGDVGAERHGERGGGGGAHRRVEPRQPADRAAADEHEHRGGHGGERAGGDRARLRLARQRTRAGDRQREGEHGSRARHGPPGDDRARARDGPRHEEGARDRVHEHSGILAYGMPWIQPSGRE